MKLLAQLLTSLSFFPATFVAAQQLPPPAKASDPSATALLSKSLAALTGNASVSDVTLSGTARRVAGSDDETGTGIFKALASGAGRSDLSLSLGQRSEVVNFTGTNPTGAWSGPDRISHAMSYHNLLTEPAWFFPAFAIARRLSNSAYVATYVGHESHNGQAVEHVSVSQTPPSPDDPPTVSFEHLSQVDFYLDSSTLLPAAVAFSIHPDNNALLDLPIEIRFSDYRATGGSQIPFHVQKFLNNSLLLDFQAQSATINSGLSTTDFNLP